MAQLGGMGWLVWFHVSLSCSLCKSARHWRSSAIWSARCFSKTACAFCRSLSNVLAASSSAVWSVNRLCNTDMASCNAAAIVLVMATWGMTFRMSSGAFTGSNIPRVLPHERHLISMIGDNRTALKLRPQAQRTDRACSTPTSQEPPKLLEPVLKSTFLWSADAPQHHADHRKVKHSLRIFDFGFVVAYQAAVLHKPAEGALDDPAPGQHFEAALVLETGDNFQAQAAGLAMRGDPGSKSSPQIALIGPDT